MWPFKDKPEKKRAGFLDTVGVIPSSIEFRRDEKTQSEALQLLSSPVGHLMLSILRNESPMRISSVPGGATSEQVMRAYGVVEGYEMALASLALLAEPAQDNTPITETFTDDYKD